MERFEWRLQLMISVAAETALLPLAAHLLPLATAICKVSVSSKMSTFEENRELRNLSSSEPSQSETPDKPRVKKVFNHDETPYKAARWLTDQIEARLPTCKPYTEKQLQAWALDFDRCSRLDGHPWEEINDVLSFSQSDSFWQQNIFSGGKLRKQYVTLLAKMNGGKS